MGDGGVAGRSAEREYRRRLQLDRERGRLERPRRLVVLVLAIVGGYLAVQIIAAIVDGIIHTHGATTAKSPFPASTAHDIGVLFALVAGLAVAGNLWGKRQTTEAWGVGAVGERAVAARLEGVPGVIVLHDRRIPGSRANIDHIAIGPGGVYVIDAKNVSKGRVSARQLGPIWNRGPTKLLIGGRDRTSFVEGMAKQVEVVARALAGIPEAGGVPIKAMVVVVGAEWGLLARPVKVRGVWVGWPKEAARVVARPGPLGAEVRGRLAQVLMERLPEA